MMDVQPLGQSNCDTQDSASSQVVSKSLVTQSQRAVKIERAKKLGRLGNTGTGFEVISTED